MTNNEQMAAFEQTILEDPDPLHKLVFADWLEENGQSKLSFAYRWAGTYKKHPKVSVRKKVFTWDVDYNLRPTKIGKTGKGYSSFLINRFLFKTICRLNKRSNVYTIRATSISNTFELLAEALDIFKTVVSLDNG